MVTRPSFLDAYLVASDSTGAAPVGVVRRERHVWKIMRFGIPDEDQPREVFGTREAAGERLPELSAT